MKKRKANRRLGVSATEVIVAATLLLSMIGLVIPMSIRSGKILRDARYYQMAMNELSNQFDYLSSLSDAQREAALTQLQVSDQVRQSLTNASLDASQSTTEDGVRLTLSLNWDRGVDAKPVQLTGWLTSSIADSTTAQLEHVPAKEDSDETT